MSKVRILFVCMGNICRSPSAEGVFLDLLSRQALHEHFDVDSAGTHGYHIGEQADLRSMQHAHLRGIDITAHRARQVEDRDFEIYDYILAMDKENYRRLMGRCPETYKDKVHLFMAFAPHLKVEEVPDPYYGGKDGFEHVLDLVEAASEGLLEDIRQNHLSHLN